jgi:hypothetical protein
MDDIVIRASLLEAFLAAALLALASTAHAETTDPQGAARSACAADYQTLCASESRGGGRIYRCLKARENELSPACKAVIQGAAARTR